MADETAASSTAEVDVFNGQEPTLTEYNHYRAEWRSARTIQTSRKSGTGNR